MLNHLLERRGIVEHVPVVEMANGVLGRSTSRIQGPLLRQLQIIVSRPKRTREPAWKTDLS